MSSKKFKAMLLILCFSMSAFFTTYMTYGESNPITDTDKNIEDENLELSSSTELIDLTNTSIVILDNPGKTLSWNQTGNLLAKLIVKEDDAPIPFESLELYFEDDGVWMLLSTGITNEEGIVEFSFHVELTNGDYHYKVKYNGNSVFKSSEALSYFTVIDDPINPVISITNIECTDGGIKIDFKASISLGYLASGGLTGISVIVSIGLYSYIMGYSFDSSENIREFSDSLFIEYLRYLLIFDKAHVGELFDMGYSTVNVLILASAYYEEVKFIIIPIPPFYIVWTESHSTSAQFFNSYPLIDDDIQAPTFENYNFDPSITVQSSGSYNIYFSYRDASGWEGFIQYQFINETYESPIYEDWVDQTISTEETEFTYSIPKQIWSSYPDTRIQFRTKAIDFDIDGGRLHDRMSSNWTGWIGAGYIFSVVNGILENIKAYASTQTANGWEWQLRTISPDSPNLLYKELYINDDNIFELTICNPLSENIYVSNAFLSFSCPKFSGDRPYPIPITFQNPILPNQTIIKTIFQKFDPSFFIDLESTNIIMEFSFDYAIESVPDDIFHISNTKEYSIITPPIPTIEFLGFEGPQENGKFIYKYKGEGSKIYAKLRIINNARIPIDLSNYFNFTDEVPLERQYQLEIITYKELSVYPQESHEIGFPLVVFTAFFASENLLETLIFATIFIKPLGYIRRIISGILAFELIKTKFKTYISKVRSGLRFLSAAMNAILALYNGYLLSCALNTIDSMREYNFNLKVSWRYRHYDGVNEFISDYTTFNYEKYEITTEKLYLYPSSTQMKQYFDGNIFRIAAIVSYSIAAILFLSKNPFVILAAIIASIVADISVALSNSNWNDANDDIPLANNYSEVYQPTYDFYNLSNYVPRTEFELVSLQYANTSIKYLGDYNAFNITKSRKQAALEAGDYDAVIVQNNALINYTDNLIENSLNLKRDLELLNNYYVNNASEIEDNIYNVESSIIQNGLSEKDIEVLESEGYNQTEIQEFNQTIIDFANRRVLSQNITNLIFGFEENLDKSNELLDDRLESLEKFKREIINETINIKTTTFNENITKADNERLMQLELIKDEIQLLFLDGEWNAVIQKSKSLYELAQKTTLETNNNTYLEVYGKFAMEYQNKAKEYLKLNLYHLREISITDNEKKTISVIAHSEGAPSGDYILETNCTWITPTQQTVHIDQYKRTPIELTISTENNLSIIPGRYPVRFTLYLPQTKTIIYSIMLIKVIDDDTTPPEVIIDYTGDGTDGNAGKWAILTRDIESGIDTIEIYRDGQAIEYKIEPAAPIGYIYILVDVPESLGTHTLSVIVENDDNDWLGDSETNSTSNTIIIKDDDTTPPTITINYIGDNNDGNPGYFEWILTDNDDGIGGDEDIGFSDIIVSITYESTEELEDYIINVPGTEIGSWNLPSNLGIYTISIFAQDNDDDRTLLLDSLSVELINTQEIIDDDVNPPELSNLQITHDIHTVNITFIALDQSGISDVNIFVNEEMIEPIAQSQLDHTYTFILANQWILKNGIYDVEIQVIDGDNDRSDDALNSSIFGVFELTVKEMYDYVIWQIGALKDYINNNSCWIIAKIFSYKLSLAQLYLERAFFLLEAGKITCSQFGNLISKILVQITECKVEILSRFHIISSEVADFIITSLHDIRNNIVILMGATTGTDEGYSIALTICALLNLKDLIDTELNWWNGRCLEGLISSVATSLEWSLIKLTLDFDIEWYLNHAQFKLDLAKYKLNRMVNIASISQELADIILNSINQAYQEIETIKISL